MNTFNLNGSETNCYYYIDNNNRIYHCLGIDPRNYIYYTLEEFLEKFLYKVGDTVLYKPDNTPYFIIKMFWKNNKVLYELSDKINLEVCRMSYTLIPDVDVVKLQPYKEETMEDKGNISDGYHTFNELYEYRLLYNASMFNELAKQGLYDVHKSKRHSDGTIPFGDENWFIVQAELPTGQISNHYEMKDWELFNVPEKEKANHYDGHTPQDVAKRLRNFLTPKPKYPKTYEECCEIVKVGKEHTLEGEIIRINNYKIDLLESFQKLLICRDAYWKIAGEEMGLGKPWEPDYDSGVNKYGIICMNGVVQESNPTTNWERHLNKVLDFPTKEMRNTFYENFKELIEQCKELL